MILTQSIYDKQTEVLKELINFTIQLTKDVTLPNKIRAEIMDKLQTIILKMDNQFKNGN